MVQANQQQKILILAAIPHGLRLDKEISEIEEAIRGDAKRDLFEIRIRTAVRPKDIRHAIAEEKPQIVHFCGHGLEDGSLLLEDERGQNKPVSPEGLASLFQLHANYVNCVVLNACHSAKTAAAISKYINYAIGMNQPIKDKAAIAFAQGFYDGLGYPISGNQDVFQRAFEEGKVAIQLEIDKDKPVKLPEHLIPVLLKNPQPVSPTKRLVNFETDIFISYAAVDNQSFSKDQEGWVSYLRHFLEIRLEQLRGKKARILLPDPKLQENEYIDDAIVAQLSQVGLLIPVLSPSYVQSPCCLQELQTFCDSARQTVGIRVAGDQERIFQVIKTPIPSEQQPPELQILKNDDYRFYEIDQVGKLHEFNEVFGSDWKKKCCAKLQDLAYDIYEMLKIFQQQEVEEVSHNKPTGIRIYLAETTYELREARDKIRRELQQRGYIVLPSQPLPYNHPNCSEVVHENLEDCKLSIHLVGNRYGIIPEGLKQSVEELQYAWAKKQKQHNSEFSYLVWIPNELQPEDPRQLKFIHCLQDEPELLQTTLEDLKTIIQDRLNPRQPSSEPKEKEEEETEVYLIYDQRDLDIIEPVEDYLWSQEWEVILPMFEGNEAEVRQYHQESLRDCDAVLIYYGQGNELWLRTQLREVQKAAGYGRRKPMLAKAIYVAGTETTQKKRFRTRQATVIKHFDEFSPHILEPFRVQVTQSQGGQQ